MPTWTGWNEQAVRQKPANTDSLTSAAVPVPTMGFTAINASRAGNIGPQSTSQTQAITDDAGSSERKTMPSIAEYLGRGDTSDPPVTQALRGAGAKKASGRGRKRAGTANTSSTRKRRKVSDVSERMAVTKPVEKQAKTKASMKADTASSSVQSEVEVTTHLPPGTPDESIGHDSGLPISVFAPPTSMSSHQHSTQQTSINALKSIQGRTKTIYRRTQTLAEAQASLTYAEPWMKQQDAAHSGEVNKASTRVLRPRKEKPAEEEVVWNEEEPIAPKRKDQLNNSDSDATSFHTAATQTKAAAQRQPSCSSETFFEDDDDMSDALIVADRAEKAATPLFRITKDGNETQTPTQFASDAPAAPTTAEQQAKTRESTPILTADEEFVPLDDQLVMQSEGTIASDHADEEPAPPRSPTPPTRERRFNMREVDHNEDYDGGLLSDGEREVLTKLRSSALQQGPKPMVRLPFPNPVLDRSPIWGATNTTTLRTCFRIGEALKEGCQAVRSNRSVILELYARVTASWREPVPSRKQHFMFKDLYHDRPPHLEGTYELWGQSQLWDIDGQSFLQAAKKKGGVMCRVVARMKRVETKWRLEILSFWEAGWDDVELAGEIFAKVYEFPRD
ncbi:uncharacterized protein LTR77_007741 [Saxophila tyrrhenica]|uniref:Uncharacterized protein n=1 Tax=Saxophila tyrrhenica TaxID=1690608 RepID=A0AAV9P2V0_9PEZI|nr:hypothetical protein LTR77_007741 [Saxophila tyrrhenica]